MPFFFVTQIGTFMEESDSLWPKVLMPLEGILRSAVCTMYFPGKLALERSRNA